MIGPSRAAGFVPSQPAGASLPAFTYTVVRSYPHDPAAFTQGLQWVDGFLYEGTGNHGASSIRKVQLETGEVLQKRDLADQYFGEGIVVQGDELVQLTYKTEIGFVYDRATFAPKRTFRYQGEGRADTAYEMRTSPFPRTSRRPVTGSVRRTAAASKRSCNRRCRGTSGWFGVVERSPTTHSRASAIVEGMLRW